MMCMLLLTGAITYYGNSIYGQSSGPIAFGYVACTGDEDSLIQCSRSVFSVVSGSCTSHYYDLGLKCERKTPSLLISYHAILLPISTL